MNPRHNVRPGDKLRIAAEQINFLNGMMRPDTGFKSGPLHGYQPGGNVVLCRNNTNETVDRWSVLQISGLEIDPSDGEDERRSFEEMPCVTGIVPAGSFNKFVVTFDPIKAGAIGRAIIAGVVQVRIQVDHEAETRCGPESGQVGRMRSKLGAACQILWREGGTGEQWGLVRIGQAASGLRIGKTTAAWNKGTLATIAVYEDGTPPNETSSNQTIVDVVNHWGDVPANKWVGVMSNPVTGFDYLVVAEC